MILPIKNTKYGQKDKVKASICTKYIGRGSELSSTHFYAMNLPKDIVNCGVYTNLDTVYISVEGDRSNRLSFDEDEVMKAIQARAKLVTDNSFHRKREYNVGEREIAAFLSDNNYLPKEYPEGCVWVWSGDTLIYT